MPYTIKGILLTRGIATATDALEITLEQSKQGTLMYLNGRINIDSSPVLRNRLLAMLREQSAEAIMVDLTGVSYIDASGIATLIEGLKVARNRQVRLCLQGLQGRLMHLFEATGVLALFEASGCEGASSAPKVS
jgi:anti-sigma B factor antagonist